MAGKKLYGCIPIVVTPFDPEGRVDEESLRREVDWLIDGGVHGLATLALASEGYKLSDAERAQVAQAVVDQARGRVPVIISADHSGADVAVERARQAQAWGADGVMVLPPSFIKPDGDALYRYYAAVANALSAPVIVQDAPQLTGVNMPASFLARLADEFPHVNVAKLEGVPSGPKISEIMNLTGGRMVVFTGWGGLGFWDGLLRGDVGCMPAACFGPSLARVYNLYAAGKVPDAWKCFDAQAHFVAWSMQTLDISVWTSKLALLREGVIASATQRDPATPGDPVMQAQFEVYWEQFSRL
ncbi:MAG: dihydrodipicolinate synthase family protein [Chloroflexi bacterium]|nr:dihydrodipicolinate synthase family protein [Chloroflexota bacterium]